MNLSHHGGASAGVVMSQDEHHQHSSALRIAGVEIRVMSRLEVTMQHILTLVR